MAVDPTGKPRPIPRTYALLNFYRFVCACFVAVGHYSLYFPVSHETRVRLFVAIHPVMGFFFILSGFVVMHVYDGKVSSWSTYGDYLRKRLARIYPLFLATFMITYLYVRYTKNESLMFASSAILPNLLLIHAWNTTRILTFDYPSWSISAEMFVYLLFPLFLLVINRLGRFAFTLPFILAAAVVAVFSVFGLGYWIEATFNAGCLRAVPSFVAGMVIYRLVAKNLAGFRPPVWLAHVMAMATLPLSMSGAPGYATLLYMAGLVFVLAAAEPDAPGVLSRPFARGLANASYGFYLLHVPVAEILIRSVAHHWRMPAAANYALAPLAFVLTTALAVASFRYFENPLRRVISRGFPSLALSAYRTAR